MEDENRLSKKDEMKILFTSLGIIVICIAQLYGKYNFQEDLNNYLLYISIIPKVTGLILCVNHIDDFKARKSIIHMLLLILSVAFALIINYTI